MSTSTLQVEVSEQYAVRATSSGEASLPADEAVKEPEARSDSQADLIVGLIDKSVELFRTPGGHDASAFATLTVRHGEHGIHRETWPVTGKGFEHWLSGQFYRRYGKAPRGQSLQDALSVIVGRALHEGREHPVAVRLAEHDGAIYLDLADEEWRCVKITADVWQVVPICPIRFVRHRGMLPLPIPVEGGSLDELRKYINVRSDDDWILAKSWLVGAMRPQGPYVVMNFIGEQGSTKSTVSKVLRSLLDPNEAPLRAAPHSERDLVITASNSRVLVFDNLSHIRPWLSDALCRVSTGGGYATRELYRDTEEKLFSVMRPIVLNGITEVATRSDLLDRAIVLDLPAIPEAERKTEAEFWNEFNSARPRILGGLLDAVSAALRNEAGVKLPGKPRMADFAVWATAAESAMGVPPGGVMRAYTGNREEAVQIALDASPVGSAILSMMEARESWEGTATDLLDQLNQWTGNEGSRYQDWPRNPRAPGEQLSQIMPNLRRSGMEIERSREGKGRTRMIRLRFDPPRSSASSALSANTDRTGEKLPSPAESRTKADNDLTSVGSACPPKIGPGSVKDPHADGADKADNVTNVFENSNRSVAA